MSGPKTVTLPKKKSNDTGTGEQQGATHAACGEEQLRERAYHKWEEAGCPCGDGVEFWLQAEAELATECQIPSTTAEPRASGE